MSLRAWAGDAVLDVKSLLARLARQIILVTILAICAIVGAIYLVAASYQYLLPLLGPAGANMAMGAIFALICLGLLAMVKRG